HGVGILYTGSPGIGKSECALSLVEKGHRLIADDVVNIRRKAGKVLLASGEAEAGFHLEIRGVGIIDIEKLYGIRAVRIQKRLEIQVHLELWDSLREYERLGLDETTTTILGIEIPKITIPVSPGKNITAISEVVAMNHMLKVYGHHPAREFMARMNEIIRRRELTDQYLESDYE
ncbi:MAG: HPr(Ser) kinase/phosphatase, partial [bacterium]